MKVISLPASLHSDLEWSTLFKEGEGALEILWELDLELKSLTDQAAFHAYVIALEEFVRTLWDERGRGLVLFRGNCQVFKQLLPFEDEVEAATLFAEYFHRLASFLPDHVPVYTLFDAPKTAKEAQLLSKDRFWHLHLTLNSEEELGEGILLPLDTHCTPQVLAKLDQLLPLKKARLIPEARLTELWHGLDTLWVIEEALSVQGKRKLQGFIAAGGEVKRFGAEGFEPPTHCSQSSCASQTALCSERGRS